MITDNEAEYQVRRMAGLRGYPKGEALALDELIRVVAEAAEHETHAAQVLRLILDSCDICPKPSELRKFFFDTRNVAGPICATCNGNGWVSTGEWVVTTAVDAQRRTREWRERITTDQREALKSRLFVSRQMVYDAAKPCPDCNAGQEVKE